MFTSPWQLPVPPVQVIVQTSWNWNRRRFVKWAVVRFTLVPRPWQLHAGVGPVARTTSSVLQSEETCSSPPALDRGQAS